MAALDAGSVLSSAARPLHGCRGRCRGLCRAFADLAVPPADHRRREQRQLRRVVPERGAQRELDVGRGQQLRGRRAHAARRLVRRQHVRLEPVTTRADRLAPEPAATHVRAGGARMCAGSFAARPPRSRASAGRAVRAARAWWSASTTASTRRRRGAPTCTGALRAARGHRAASACRGVLEVGCLKSECCQKVRSWSQKKPPPHAPDRSKSD